MFKKSVYFRLIRFPNLLIVGLTQGLLYYCVILPFFFEANIHTTLGSFNFLLLVITTMLIAAGGYIVNDIYDQDIDRINKPDHSIVGVSISETQARRLYLGFVLIGGIIAVYLGWVENKLALLPIYPIAVALLWAYAGWLKRLPLWGNLVVAIFCAFVAGIVWVGEQEAWSLLKQQDQLSWKRLTALLVAYLWFAFASTLYRELIKDLEDEQGDAAIGCRTLPVVIGRERTKVFTCAVGILLLISLFFWGFDYHQLAFSVALAYLILGIIIPLSWSIIRLSRASTSAEFHVLSQWAKYLMVSGLIYFLLIGYGV